MFFRFILFLSFLFILSCKKENNDLINEIPYQKNIENSFVIAKKENADIWALADFDIKAKVLSIENYKFDRGAKFAPYDFVMGWQKMSDNQFLSKIKITQGNRFYFWHVDTQDMLRERENISTQSANMHLVPANDIIKKQLSKINKNDSIEVKGYLIKIEENKKFTWISSLTRTDTGEGACELIWVTEVSKL